MNLKLFQKIYERADCLKKIKNDALLALGIYVERGFDGLLTDADIDISIEDYKADAKKLGASVRLEQLLADKYFMLSARMGYLRCLVKDRENLSDIFLKRLWEIFPQTVADKLCEEMTISWQLDSSNLDNEIQELNEYRKSFLKISNTCADRKASNRKVAFSLKGTPTYLLKCPKCNAQKRCDANTKNFACKSCGHSDVRNKPK